MDEFAEDILRVAFDSPEGYFVPELDVMINALYRYWMAGIDGHGNSILSDDFEFFFTLGLDRPRGQKKPGDTCLLFKMRPASICDPFSICL